MAKAKNKALEGTARARVLYGTEIDGRRFSPDDVVEADAALIAVLAESGVVDPHPDAVEYAESLKDR